MKIKDKLIHLLGGLTREEHLFMDHASKIHRYSFMIEQPVRTLKAWYCISDRRHQPPDDFLQHELMAKLAKKILEEKLVSFYTKPRYPWESDYPQDVCAMIRVVDTTERGER